MNEQPKSIWTRPWSGRNRRLAWLGILALVVAVALWIGDTVLNPNDSLGERVSVSLFGTILLTIVAAVAVAFFRWVWCWRNFKRFLFGVACVVTLVALFFAVENWRGHHAWQNHKREWEAKGEKFSFASIIPPAVADDQNFAMVPLLRPIYDFTQGTNGLLWNDTNGTARLGKIRADVSPNRKTNENLVLGSLEKGTYANIAVCGAFYVGNTNYPQAAPGATPAEAILVALAKFGPELQNLQEAADTRPAARFPIHYEYEPPWAILLPHLAHVKGLTTLCEVRATAELESGQIDKAFEDLKLGLRLSDSLSQEPLLIDHLVRIATLAINLQTVREGLVRHAWTDAQLAELENRLARLNLLAEYKMTMRGERVLGTTGLDFLRRQGLRSRQMFYLGNEEGGASSVWLTPMPGGWFYQNMLTISELCQDYTLPAVDEQAHRIFPKVSEAGGQAFRKMRWGPYTYFAKILSPALEKVVRKPARMQVFVDATRVACALERYRLANGKTPDSLEPIVPQFISAIPVDIIDGKPLRYKLSSDGSITLYSIGWDECDDGGKVVWTKGKDESRVDPDHGDWVWQLTADRKHSAATGADQ